MLTCMGLIFFTFGPIHVTTISYCLVIAQAIKQHIPCLYRLFSMMTRVDPLRLSCMEDKPLKFCENFRKLCNHWANTEEGSSKCCKGCPQKHTEKCWLRQRQKSIGVVEMQKRFQLLCKGKNEAPSFDAGSPHQEEESAQEVSRLDEERKCVPLVEKKLRITQAILQRVGFSDDCWKCLLLSLGDTSEYCRHAHHTAGCRKRVKALLKQRPFIKPSGNDCLNDARTIGERGQPVTTFGTRGHLRKKKWRALSTIKTSTNIAECGDVPNTIIPGGDAADDGLTLHQVEEEFTQKSPKQPRVTACDDGEAERSHTYPQLEIPAVTQERSPQLCCSMCRDDKADHWWLLTKSVKEH